MKASPLIASPLILSFLRSAGRAGKVTGLRGDVDTIRLLVTINFCNWLRIPNRTDSVYKCDFVPAKSVEMTGCTWTAINFSASLSPDLVTKNVVNRIITADQCPYYISVCFQPARHLIELIIAALKSQIALWTRRLFRKIVRYILFGSMRSELRLDYDNNLNVMQIAKKIFCLSWVLTWDTECNYFST